MKFVDTLELTVHAGDGGNGCVSFRRELYIPRGGPDGGNGGNGGNVVVLGEGNCQTLLDLRHRAQYNAENGGRGKGKDMTGRSGEDLVVQVPFGTMVYDAESGELIADITADNAKVVIAQGGRGGRGNTSFTSSTHRAPRICEPGTEGQSRRVKLELKLIADVGIVGYPNAGKSTFISVVSAARPKIADYPFTTLTPVLGVVKNEIGGSYVIADMPGLIEDAHKGVGLGLRFLRHIERTRLLLHFVDASEERSMVERYHAIRKELESYSDAVASKDEVVVATKLDSAISENVEEFVEFMEKSGKKYFIISALSKEGLSELLKWMGKDLNSRARVQISTDDEI